MTILYHKIGQNDSPKPLRQPAAGHAKSSGLPVASPGMLKQEMDIQRFRGFALNADSYSPGLPLHSPGPGGTPPSRVILRQRAEYSRLISSHLPTPPSVSGLIASAGHSGSHTPQSMHSSGWMTSMFSPS